VITNTRVAAAEGTYSGPLYVTIADKESKIADDAIAAWIIRNGQAVIYSGRDGSGGYENEGQSLRIYDTRTGRHRKILSEYFEIDKITEVTSSKKRIALLVEMSDSGLGASSFAVVDPARGEVFVRRWAKLISRQGDIIVIGYYKEGDWAKFNENENAQVKPYKTERHNLDTILKSRVIINKPHN